ncbi:MAG: 50S ribosomal protein L10 [Minisyncoccia bacterium]
MEKKKKREVVQDLIENFKKAQGAYFLNFAKLKTKDLNELRREVGQKEGKVRVIKNNLLKIAFQKLGLGGLEMEQLKGQTMVSFAFQDPVGVANILDKFMKDKENIKVVGGLLENEWLTNEVFKKLAKIPSKEILIGKLISGLKSPVFRLDYSLKGNLLKLAHSLRFLAGRNK